MTNNELNGSNTYRDQQILTASPARLVTMLYEKAIICLRQAVKAIEVGDVKARWAANVRAVEIIEHLSMTLDTEKGGQFATDLERLYPFMIRHLINVDVHNDPEPALEVIALLVPMHEAWRSLDQQFDQNELAEAAASATPAPVVAATVPEAPSLEIPTVGRISATA